MIARALALTLLWAGFAASAEVAVPALSVRVTDLTGTLDPGQRAALEARLETFERAKGSQVVVLIVPTTQPETIEQYAIRVADTWKIGRRRGIDDGVIVILALDDHAVRIEVGDGLEGALPDAIANRITDDVMVPRFRAHDYYGGISEGVERIIGAIEGEPLPPPSSRGDGALPSDAALWVTVIVPLLVGGLVRLAHNRATGALVAGSLSGALGLWSIGAPMGALVLALFCAAIVFGASGGSRGWASGGWSGGGGSSGGGGGFSGGGGHFSGGGASGRW